MSTGNVFIKSRKNVIKTVKAKNQLPLYYLGPDLEKGPLPAFFYFSLSGEESLSLPPYSQPATLIADDSLRVFSLTIPGHEEGKSKFHAMEYWAEKMAHQEPILEEFFDQAAEAIDDLITQNSILPTHIATGGLSRGGFVATHVAARVSQIQTVLGFAPLTQLNKLKEFETKPELFTSAEKLDLTHLVDALSHVHHLRFYIGNLDTRVSTDACYNFIRHRAEVGHHKHLRHQKTELMITQSIGHKGHGTSPSIFEEGAFWVKKILTI